MLSRLTLKPFAASLPIARTTSRLRFLIPPSPTPFYRPLSSSSYKASNNSTTPTHISTSLTINPTRNFTTTTVTAMQTSFNPTNRASRIGMNDTSGNALPVWVITDPYENKPQFSKLGKDLTTDIVVVGAGMAGISTAYELVKAGKRVTLLEAREVISGETGRTSGHLASFLDDEASELVKTFGEDRAKKAYESHQYALERIGEISKSEGIECEYRIVPGQMIVEVPDTHPDYSKHNDLREQYETLKKIGVDVNYTEKGKVGEAYTGAILEFPKQALFHPTKYLNGVLKVLQKSPLFDCYTHTRMESYKDHGSGKGVDVKTEGGHTVRATNMVMATNVPLQEIEIIGKESYYRTYCTAHRIPTGSFPDISLYDNGDPYIYVRKTTSPDPSFEYLIVGGEDHKVASETTEGYTHTHYDKLAKWALAHYPSVDPSPEFKWSGQIVEPNDYMAYIGLNTGIGTKNVYVSTGDSGNGLTHGVIAGRLLCDLIISKSSPWESLYSPSRLPKPRTIPEVISENVNQQVKYARYVKTDVSDIESIPRCSGAVMHAGLSKLKKPLAVYKDGEGNVSTFSAICPHLKGVVAWNAAEGSWDCPIHGSRFDGITGKCVMGPAVHGLNPEDEGAKGNVVGSSG